MKFDRRDTRVWTALVSPRLALRIAPEDIWGMKGKYRLDRKTLAYEPWEAVASDTFATKAKAVAFAKAWLRSEEERLLREIASVL